MADAITMQGLIDANLDVETLGEAANEDKVVVSRLGREFVSAPMASRIILEQGTIDATLKTTKAALDADTLLVDDDFALVYNDDDIDLNGYYQKQAGVWEYLPYNIQRQALNQIEQAKQAAIDAAKDAANSYTDSKVAEKQQNIAQNNSVSDIKIVKNISGNLLDVSKFVINKSISQTTGLETTSTYAVSPFIGVESAQSYTLNSNSRVVPRYLFFYDQYKSFISYINAGLTANGVAKTFTTPANTAYLRLETAAGTLGIYDVMLNKGETALNYTPYRSVLDGVGLPDSQINSILNNVDTSALDYIAVSDNLIKSDNLIEDKVVGSDGSIIDDGVYKITPLLSLKNVKETTLLMESEGAIRHVAWYDTTGTFISRTSEIYTANTVHVVTAPANATAFRLNVRKALFDLDSKITAVRGSVPTLQHIDYDGILKNIKLSDDNLATVMQMVNDSYVVDKDPRFYLDGASDAILRVDNTNWVDYTDWKIESVKTRSAADVYAMYDQLVTDHPDYITKEVLGQEVTGREIAVYKLKPRDYVAAHTFRKPKVFITCGTHGHEPVPPLAIYSLINAMLTQWQSNDELAFLLFNIELIVIPITNPWGWDNNERRNSNLIDINRNFPYLFAPGEVGTPTYGGTEPLSELESQYIKQVFDANTDIDVFFDFHNFVGSQQGGAYIWNNGVYDNPADGINNELMQRVSTLLFSRMQRVWAADYDWFPKDYDYKVGFATQAQGGLVAGYAAKNIGVPIFSTFELSARWEVDPNAVAYDKTHTKTMVEAVGNYLMLCIDNLKYRKS